MKTAVMRSAVALAGCGLVLAPLAPASAQSAVIRDKGDFKGAYDIQRVKVKHSKKAVVTRVNVRKLRAGRDNTVLVGIRTRPRREYALVVLVRKKPQARLFRVAGKKSVRVRCKGLRVRAQFRADRLTTRVPRACLKKPKKVRVRVKAGNLNKKLDGTRNTRWLARG